MKNKIYTLYIYKEKKYSFFNLIIYYFILIFFLISSCQNENKNFNDKEGKKISNKYSKGFSIITYKDYRKIQISNPWQGAKNITFDFILTDNFKTKNILSDYKNIIRTPVNKVICLSTTHASMISKLKEHKSIVGIAGTKYLIDTTLCRLVLEKKIEDVGFDNNLNYEKIALMKPDLVIVYGVGSEALQIINKLQDLNIPFILNAEYLEENMLAKAEWIKLIGALFNKEKLADKIFSEIEIEYLQLKNLTSEIKTRPQVLTGLPWKGTWWVAGGNSYMAQLIFDAGGMVLWNKNNSRESIPMNFENIILKSNEADIWINCGSANSKKEILNVEPRISSLYFFKKNIYNNNAITNSNGGNDFWESGIVNPHIILKDLISIFHPELLPDHKLNYYKKLE